VLTADHEELRGRELASPEFSFTHPWISLELRKAIQEASTSLAATAKPIVDHWLPMLRDVTAEEEAQVDAPTRPLPEEDA
jgi:hypothetical protein